MKIKIMIKTLLIIASLVWFATVYADNPCQGASSPYGPMTCSDGTTDMVSANGPVTMKNTVVTNSTQIKGTLNADNVTLNSLTVNGKVNLLNSTINGVTTITGYLSAKKTTFANTLTLAANDLQLDNCTTGDIVINNSGDGVVSPQTITLSGETKVNGKITFKQKGGLVYLGPQASISDMVFNVNGKLVLKQEGKVVDLGPQAKIKDVVFNGRIVAEKVKKKVTTASVVQSTTSK